VTLLEWTALTVKFAALVAVPPNVVAEILPVVAPVGTVAVICVAEFTVNVVALVVLNFTELVVKVGAVPLKFVPVIVTDVPTGPYSGVNELIVGALTVKFVALVLCPAAVYTWIRPVVAPAGTTAVTEVALVVVGVTSPEVLKRTWVGAVVKVPLELPALFVACLHETCARRGQLVVVRRKSSPDRHTGGSGHACHAIPSEATCNSHAVG